MPWLKHWDRRSPKKIIKDVRLIRERIRQAQDCQKSYLNQTRRDFEFNMGDKVFVRITLYKLVMRFGKNDWLALRFIGPFKVLEGVSKVVYRLMLPMSMDRIHNVFYVLLLCKYTSDPTYVLRVEDVKLEDNLA